jgi:iron complex outermembrane receptor protein
MSLQVYYDRYYKADAPGLTSDEINTADLDFQYRFPLAKRHNIVSGFGYRFVADKFTSANPGLAILPSQKRLDLINAFVEDQIMISERLKLIAGTKVIHNAYTGIEVQPNVRMALSVGNNNTVWLAVSRAVRTPSRIDVDYFAPVLPQPPTAVSVTGGPDFKSEKAFAYEAGYRLQPNTRSTLSLAAFYNVYHDVYSLESLPGTLTYRTLNGTTGKSWGTEWSGTYQLLDAWRIRAGYTYFKMNLKAKSGHIFDPSYLANDVQNQAMIQSMTELPCHLHIDVYARYLDYLPSSLFTIKVPAYATFDLRVAYTMKFAELAIVGQNLATRKHAEFNNLSIPRSFYAKLGIRL